MLAQRIKLLRANKKINQVQLAQEIGVSQGTVGKWETGKREPDAQMILKLADFFDVTVDCLLGRDDFAIDSFLLTRNHSGDKRELIEYFKNSVETYLSEKVEKDEKMKDDNNNQQGA